MKNMIDTACQHARSLRCLQTVRSCIEVKDDARFDLGVTCVFLYALIVELTIKGLWSHENVGEELEYTHKIKKIFDKLKPGTRAQIETIYESNRKHYTRVLLEGKRQLGEEEIHVEMASLVEALQWSKDAMVDLLMFRDSFLQEN